MQLQIHEPLEMGRMLADRVRSLRLLLGWKQSTLSERAGVSLPTLRRFERTGTTSLETFLRICHALGYLDELESYLKPAPARSVVELEGRTKQRARQRGRL